MLPEQIVVLRPIVKKLLEQKSSEGSISTDGALTLDEGLDHFPDAKRVHVWKFSSDTGHRFVVDIVKSKKNVRSITLQAADFFA